MPVDYKKWYEPKKMYFDYAPAGQVVLPHRRSPQRNGVHALGLLSRVSSYINVYNLGRNRLGVHPSCTTTVRTGGAYGQHMNQTIVNYIYISKEMSIIYLLSIQAVTH